jgi:hypothetical protein
MSSLIGDGVIIGLLVVIAIITYVIWDRRRYRGSNQGNFQRTGELFRDPSSGKLTRVWEDPATGAREYRDEPEK